MFLLFGILIPNSNFNLKIEIKIDDTVQTFKYEDRYLHQGWSNLFNIVEEFHVRKERKRYVKYIQRVIEQTLKLRKCFRIGLSTSYDHEKERWKEKMY